MHSVDMPLIAINSQIIIEPYYDDLMVSSTHTFGGID